MEATIPLAIAISPLAIAGFGGLALMLAEVFSRSRAGLAISAALIMLASALAAVGVWLAMPSAELDVAAVQPWILVDRFSLFFEALLAVGAAIAALLAGGYLREHNIERGEFYSILIFATLGGMILVAAGDSITLFLGLETLSLGAYAMTAFRRASVRSNEAAIKYFLLGSFAAGILLFGLALLYGATGHTDIAGMAQAIVGGKSHSPLVIIALVLVLTGLAFKVSAVPFHAWTPDAYEGAPTPATAYMAVVVKAAAFAMMLRVLVTVFGDVESSSWATGWPPAVALLAVVTMTVANLIAGRQESVKRMLAYSSIAHAGYLLVGVATAAQPSSNGVGGVLFYLVTYAVSTAGAFGALILCGHRGAEAVSYEDLAGIGRRHPTAALAFSLFIFSLAGVPPTAGFIGKWFIFKASIDSGLYGLAIIGFINSVVGAYYYLKVLVYMYMREPAAGAPVATPMRSGYVTTAIVVTALMVVALGVIPGVWMEAAVQAASSLRS